VAKEKEPVGVSVSIVVPCYRSALTLPTLVARLSGAMADPRRPYEIILVVDGSPDRTWEIAHGLARQHHTVRAIHLARNYGQHSALLAGVRAARYEITVTMDDDLQHPPEEVPGLIEALTEDVDLIYAVPRREEHGMLRSLASRTVKAGLAGPLGVSHANQLSAFRVFRTFLRSGCDLANGPNVSVDVALSWGTTRIRAVEVDMEQRATGRSGYTMRALIRHSANLVFGYSAAPLRMVTYLGTAVGLGGLMLLGRVLWQYFRGDTTVAGFTTLASMIALFSSAQMVATGVLGEYIGRIHVHGMGRPTYVVRQQVPETE
jgi:undecaprenyl-phosphate 4-deoxy-4-formamido-L-arabinose transferase